ncbi:MAG: hypothetical protein U9R57_15380 [Thermodesulfobacteriota bacterium]|nr:hypothetical protein [Thermodesulfobacteriota bacterium]
MEQLVNLVLKKPDWRLKKGKDSTINGINDAPKECEENVTPVCSIR